MRRCVLHQMMWTHGPGGAEVRVGLGRRCVREPPHPQRRVLRWATHLRTETAFFGGAEGRRRSVLPVWVAAISGAVNPVRPGPGRPGSA